MARGARISAVFPPDGLLHAAVNSGLTGASPGAVVRFLAYLAAGHDLDEARNRVLPKRQPLSVFETSVKEQVEIPQAEADRIRENYPDKSVAWVLRYYMAKINGATDKQAESLAGEFKAGRPEGSKDGYQRTRRSKAELESTT